MEGEGSKSKLEFCGGHESGEGGGEGVREGGRGGRYGGSHGGLGHSPGFALATEKAEVHHCDTYVHTPVLWFVSLYNFIPERTYIL